MIRNILVAGALFGLGTTAFAGPSQGDWEIVFSNMGANLNTDGDTTRFNASIRAGKFIWDSHHEIGFGATFDYTEMDVPVTDPLSFITRMESVSDETFGLGGFYRYNWASEASEKWWYAGVDLDIADAEEASDTLWLRPHFGHKWLLSDDVSFDLNLGLRIDADESDTDPQLDAQWGITVFFN